MSCPSRWWPRTHRLPRHPDGAGWGRPILLPGSVPDRVRPWCWCSAVAGPGRAGGGVNRGGGNVNRGNFNSGNFQRDVSANRNVAANRNVSGNVNVNRNVAVSGGGGYYGPNWGGVAAGVAVGAGVAALATSAATASSTAYPAPPPYQYYPSGY